MSDSRPETPDRHQAALVDLDDVTKPEAADDDATEALNIETMMVVDAVETVIEAHFPDSLSEMQPGQEEEDIITGDSEADTPVWREYRHKKAKTKKMPTPVKRRRKLWDEGFAHIPADHRFPPPMRR